jgi:hypothetical protein
MLQATVTHFPATHVTYTRSKRMDGSSSVRLVCYICLWCPTKHSIAGNYDIAKMHYEGIGKEPYGYDVRTEAVAAA